MLWLDGDAPLAVKGMASVDAGSRAGMNMDLVLVHGFWSSSATWDRLTTKLLNDQELTGLRVHRFGYESPKLSRWWRPTVRIPDYDDIAQSIPAYLHAHTWPDAPLVFVTHSQGGLIVQRFLAWMLNEGRGRELARVRLLVLLACPNEGSEFADSIREIAGYNRHPQAGELRVLSQHAGQARRTVLAQIVNASSVDERHCPIPLYVFAGRSDNVVSRQSAQSVFPAAEVLPGDHSSILNTDDPGNLTYPTVKRLLLNAVLPGSGGTAFDSESPTATPSPTAVKPTPSLDTVGPDPQRGSDAGSAPISEVSKYQVQINSSTGIQVGEHNTQTNTGSPPPFTQTHLDE